MERLTTASDVANVRSAAQSNGVAALSALAEEAEAEAADTDAALEPLLSGLRSRAAALGFEQG